VGQTIRTLEERWRGHKADANRGVNTALARAIRKYGANSFTVDTLFTCDKEDMDALEIGAIRQYGTSVPNGYNIDLGGQGKRKFKPYSDPVKGRLLRDARYRAKRDGIPFSITLVDLKIPDRCPIMDIPIIAKPSNGKTGPWKWSPSIHRKIPELGYVKANVQIISAKASLVQREFTLDELVSIGNWAKKQSSRVLKKSLSHAVWFV
jgi:hypothetical protein